MTDETFLNMMRFAREQAPDLHKMVVEAIDPYLSIEKECCDSIDWEEFLKRMSIISILKFIQEHKIDLTLSSEEKRIKHKLIACVTYTLKRDPVTLLRQKRVDNIERDISFSKNFVEDDTFKEEREIVRDSMIRMAMHRRRGVSSEKDDIKVDMLFGKVPPTSLHPDLLQLKRL
jgi:hypothetical protein